jgi:sugar O-acyltransferase (sialic acid O-acetyltransferase NeuD family)
MKTGPLDDRPLVLLGAGGHAKVVLALARAAGWRVIGVCDPVLAREGTRRWRDVPVLGDDDALAVMGPDEIGLVNGIGQTPGATARRAAFERFAQRRYRFPALVHPGAIVDPSANLGEGAQVMAGAIVQADCRIGSNTIVNTRAGVDHDCVVGAHVHIAPSATLCGAVGVGDGAFIGSACTIVQCVSVGAQAIVGAATLLLRDLAPGERWLGPSRS